MDSFLGMSRHAIQPTGLVLTVDSPREEMNEAHVFVLVQNVISLVLSSADSLTFLVIYGSLIL